jgi:glycosyltransferase involved in cell wall biosynthesis
MKNTVLYIGNFSFPLGNAAGKRVYANGKILKELGYEVNFIGMSKEISNLQTLEVTKNEHEGFVYYNLPYPNKSIDWVNYKNIFTDLVKFLTDTKIIDDLALVIYYGSPTLSVFNTKLIKFCRKHDIKVVADCVDWLTIRTNNPLFDIIKWADNTYQKAYANKKADGIIAISSYLDDYYRKFGCKTVIVPPLSPVNYKIPDVTLINGNKKTITYAGLPFRIGQQLIDCKTLKDRIDKTIILLHYAMKDGCNFVFNIYGFTKEEYLQAIPEQKVYVDELKENIVFHGLKLNSEVVESIINTDFTILIRDINRDTTAGFPTKVSESISCGTPVITTKTSDLENYIIEGENGFFIDIEDEKNSVRLLEKILKLDKEEIKKMKRNCIESKAFHYENYAKKLDEFLIKVMA